MQKYLKPILLLASLLAPCATVLAESLEARVARLEQQSGSRAGLNMATQIEQLQQEVQTLRGLLEVTEHSIAQLRQQQQDYYDDLNYRFSQVTTANPNAKPSHSPASTPTAQHTDPAAGPMANTTALTEPGDTLLIMTPNAPSTGITGRPTAITPVQAALPAEPTPAEEKDYKAAYALLQSKQYDAAVTAFNQYLKEHPISYYTPNVYYWLGETYFLQNKLSEAQVAFEKVVEQYATHQKASDALLKLGYVYESQGDKAKAKITFSQVLSRYPDTATAKLAEGKLISLQKAS